MVLDIQTVHHILKKYSISKCKQTVCLHKDLTSTLSIGESEFDSEPENESDSELLW
jgi:hypothetical protein